LYHRDPEYPAEAMFKAVLFMNLKKMKFFTELVRYLRSNPSTAIVLGFQKKQGKICLPSKQNLWHFCNIRLKDRWDALFTLMRDEIVSRAKTIGFNLGELTLEDAMPLQSLQGDHEAEYNDHYKIKGYKVDSVTDQNTSVPLSVTVTSINADEAKNLIPQLSTMCISGIRVKEHTIDGGYDDYEMIGWMGIHGIQGRYRIHNNWVHNMKGDVQYALYQKHWHDPEFKQYASLSDILRFLSPKGTRKRLVLSIEIKPWQHTHRTLKNISNAIMYDPVKKDIMATGKNILNSKIDYEQRGSYELPGMFYVTSVLS
jgi:hypothetical protein